MSHYFSFSDFVRTFPDEDTCWEEIRKHRYPEGIYCLQCSQITTHYKITKRRAYSCSICRHQVFLLAGTIFEKSATPLRTWFYALFLMTQTQGEITIRDLQKELCVTYKTAWRIHHFLFSLMKQNDGDLLKPVEASDQQVRKWVFFNAIEIRVAQKKEQTK